LANALVRGVSCSRKMEYVWKAGSKKRCDILPRLSFKVAAIAFADR